jgi:acetoin utilization protein AcuC
MGFRDQTDIQRHHLADRTAAELTPDPLPIGPILIGSEIYRSSSYGGQHPLRIPRVSTVMDLSRALGWLPEARFRRSPRAKPAALALWHDPAYIAALQAAEARGHATPDDAQRFHLGTLSNPVFPEMFRRPATGRRGHAGRGTAAPTAARSMCPVAARITACPTAPTGSATSTTRPRHAGLRRRAGAQRIAYVDIDAHHCDGVEPAFAGDPDMLLISVHEENRWPFTGPSVR